MRFAKYITFLLAVFLCLGLSLNAFAAVPATMTYHGALNDSAGQPVNTTVDASFKIFNAETGGTEAWSESASTIDVNKGSFSVQLGASTPLTNVFDGNAYWLEISINGEKLSPRTPIESVPYAFRANSADDAKTLEGKTSAQLIASAQSGGPVSAADITYNNGASGLSATNIQAALDELAALRARVVALETTSGNHATTIATNTGKINTNTNAIATNTSAIATNAGKINTNTNAIATNSGKITTNTNAIATNSGKITTNTNAIATNSSNITTNTNAIATNSGKIATNIGNITLNRTDINALQTLTQNMKRETIKGKQAVTFTGVNVYVRSGTGFTYGTINGLGNLIVGYDEDQTPSSTKSGSHNLIVGSYHNYTSHSGFVAGRSNSILAHSASVSGGERNTTSGQNSSISGGRDNYTLSTAWHSSINGGAENKVSAQAGTIGGGIRNTAAGTLSSVSGGEGNSADGLYSSISGGQGNTTSGQWSSISGGRNNQATNNGSSVSGGWSNIASGIYTSVSGGQSNEASSQGATVSGGYNNKAAGVYATVAGGNGRTITTTSTW